MLKLTKKKYEIEEPVLLADENGNEIYKFNIQMTADELSKLKEIMFDEEMVKQTRKISQLEKEEKYEELSNLENEINEKNKKTLEEFERMVYKEHLESFKEKAGKSYYDEMTEQVYSFFFKRFVDKRLETTNTMTSSLRKAGMK